MKPTKMCLQVQNQVGIPGGDNEGVDQECRMQHHKDAENFTKTKKRESRHVTSLCDIALEHSK